MTPWSDTDDHDYDAAIERMRGLTVETPQGGQSIEHAYANEYFPLALRRMRSKARPKCRLLILTVGDQPYSVALSLVHQPADRICAIHTERSLPRLDVALRLAGVDPTCVDRRAAHLADASLIYEGIRSAILNCGGLDLRHETLIDITSGTKVMVAAASSAAGVFDIKQAYIESKELIGRFHCREEVHLIGHPLTVFGDPLRREAEAAFADRRYDIAERAFARLEERGAPGFHFGARVHLCRAYRNMDALRFKDGGVMLERAAEMLAERPRENMRAEPLGKPATIALIRRQLEMAETLARAVAPKASVATDSGLANALSRWLISQARRRRTAEPDLSTLLGYRALELAFQRRLAVHRIDAANPMYVDRVALLERYNKCARMNGQRIDLPDKISLDEGFTLLRALDDDVVVGTLNLDPKTVHSHIRARNHGVFAHGFASVSEKDAGDFLRFVVRVAKAVASADEHPPPDDPDADVDPVSLG